MIIPKKVEPIEVLEAPPSNTPDEITGELEEEVDCVAVVIVVAAGVCVVA